MKYQATKKVPGGKLVRIKIDADNTINSLTINGDFFLHPEDALPHIEQKLRGLSKTAPVEQFAKEIEQALTEKNASFIGVSSEDIAQTILEALAS